MLTFTNLGLDLDADVTLFKCDACGKEGAQSISDYERAPFTERHPAECTATATEPDRRVMTTTVEFVYLEDAPFVNRTRYVTGEGVATTEVSDEFAALPEPFVAALVELLKQQDATQCARCNRPVGFVLHQNNMGFESLKWTPTGLAREVREGECTLAVALCDLCTPFVPTAEEAQAAR